ncbi:MAG: UDP-N-acetylmuramoyl-L-alanyl-D-glutamate--2,6-diaminopimelate ligase, partial [Anaerovibrio sp.]|nr:UDP-N-acetylmuramoyl-L-alanyl-D-glutamate--2,6-diaminopimelate ligase [Anaerovibrio sp.]
MAKTLGMLADLIEGAEVIGSRDTEINDIEHDSRKATPGTLFACILGAHVDGHEFIPQAREKGAVAIITDNENAPMPAGMDVLLVPQLSEALKVIVPYFYDYPAQKMRVIGITGTNGKTSISYMIRAMLRKMGFRVGLIGTIQIMIEDQVLPVHNTTPDVVELQHTMAMMLEKNMDYVVMEVSSHALDQNRVAGVEFDTAVFTNLTQDHLDYHKTFEN